jgi:hypothetical protein
LVATDHQTGQFGSTRTAFECHFKRIPVQVAAEIFLDVHGADADGIGVQHPTRLHHFEAAAAQGIFLDPSALALLLTMCIDEPCESGPQAHVTPPCVVAAASGDRALKADASCVDH